MRDFVFRSPETRPSTMFCKEALKPRGDGECGSHGVVEDRENGGGVFECTGNVCPAIAMCAKLTETARPAELVIQQPQAPEAENFQ